MKKYAIGFFVFAFMMLPFASAQFGGFGDFRQASENVVRFIEDFFGPIFGALFNTTSFDEYLFVKALFLIVLFLLIRFSLSNFPRLGERQGVVIVISLIVSILAIRYLGDISIVKTILIPYSVLGIAITSIIPFIIFFYFIEASDSSAIRKFGWTTFFVIFSALAISRWNDLRVSGGYFDGWSAAWIYFIIAIIAGIFLIFDNRIHTARMVKGLLKISDREKRIKAANIATEIEGLQEQLSATGNPKARNDILSKIRDKKRAMEDLMRS